MVYFTGTPQFQYQKENRKSANHSCCSSKSCAVIGCLAVFFLVLKLGGTSEINHPVSYLKILRTKLIGKMWNEVCIDLVSHAFAELLTADCSSNQPQHLGTKFAAGYRLGTFAGWLAGYRLYYQICNPPLTLFICSRFSTIKFQQLNTTLSFRSGYFASFRWMLTC